MTTIHKSKRAPQLTSAPMTSGQVCLIFYLIYYTHFKDDEGNSLEKTLQDDLDISSDSDDDNASNAKEDNSRDRFFCLIVF